MEKASCNTFVVLPSVTSKGCIIFGKNSDWPPKEVNELIYEAPKQCTAGETLKCTYIAVKQVKETFGVILSKPAKMWGCEMGANDQGVVIGNEAILTEVSSSEKRSIAMDLVRLALERSKTAEGSIDVITKVFSEYICSGVCIDPVSTLCSSFLIADPREVWVLEMVGEHWAAQKVTSGFRNISNCFTIETQFEKSSPDVISFAKEKGFWDGEGDFNFAAAYSSVKKGSDFKPSQEYLAGQELLRKYTESNSFNVKDMFLLLRDKEKGICSGLDSEFPTNASQVSVLSKNRPCCHWFTATPDPTVSVFKPFIFTPDVRVSLHTKSPVEGGDRRHMLYRLHEAANSNANNNVISLLQEMERNCLEEVEKFLDEYQEGQSLNEFDEILKDVVETEVKFYK